MGYHTFTRKCDGMCDSCDCDESVRLPDSQRGLYEKYSVRRADGSSEPGGKHEGCEYFVLDLTHDKHAGAALQAYASSCAAEYPALAADLLHKLAPAEAVKVLPGVTYMDPPDGGSVTVEEQLQRMSEDAARWRHVWRCVRMAQHGEYVLMPEDPTGLPEDSIVRARFLRDVDEWKA